MEKLNLCLFGGWGKGGKKPRKCEVRTRTIKERDQSGRRVTEKKGRCELYILNISGAGNQRNRQPKIKPQQLEKIRVAIDLNYSTREVEVTNPRDKDQPKDPGESELGKGQKKGTERLKQKR